MTNYHFGLIREIKMDGELNSRIVGTRKGKIIRIWRIRGMRRREGLVTIVGTTSTGVLSLVRSHQCPNAISVVNRASRAPIKKDFKSTTKTSVLIILGEIHQNNHQLHTLIVDFSSEYLT